VPEGSVEMPSYEEVSQDKIALIAPSESYMRTRTRCGGRAVFQRHGGRPVLQFPPAPPLPQARLDEVYRLPFERAWHPEYTIRGVFRALKP